MSDVIKAFKRLWLDGFWRFLWNAKAAHVPDICTSRTICCLLKCLSLFLMCSFQTQSVRLETHLSQMGPIYLQMFWECVPPCCWTTTQHVRAFPLQWKEDTAAFKPVLCLCCGSGPPLCHWDCLVLRIDDAIAGLGGGVDVGVKGGASV